MGPASIDVADILERAMPDPRATVVMIDYDGTLAPIVDDPAAAVPVDGAASALEMLAREVADVAIVSGRPLEFLEQMLPGDLGLSMYGVYGLEVERQGERSRDPRIAAFGDVIAIAAADARQALPAARIEEKLGAVMTIHWREHPELEADAMAVAQRLADAHALLLFPGRMSVELRVPIEVSKASTMTTLAPLYANVILAGDDAADLDALRAVRELVAEGQCGGVCAIAVASPEAPPGLLEEADLVVGSPHEFVRVLGWTAALLRARGVAAD